MRPQPPGRAGACARPAGTDDAGSATVLVVAAAGVLVLVLGALLGAAMIAAAHRKAAAVADLTALAAASDGPSCARAATMARANGARLLSCLPGTSDDVTIQVAVDLRLPRPADAASVTGTARAGRTSSAVGSISAVSARAGAP
jgi:secretion/DNA translocation related TadE-like protein